LRNALSAAYVATFGPTQTANKREKKQKEEKIRDIGTLNLFQGNDRIPSALKFARQYPHVLLIKIRWRRGKALGSEEYKENEGKWRVLRMKQRK